MKPSGSGENNEGTISVEQLKRSLPVILSDTAQSPFRSGTLLAGEYRAFSVPKDLRITLSWTRCHFSTRTNPFPRINFASSQCTVDHGKVYLFGGLIPVLVPKQSLFGDLIPVSLQRKIYQSPSDLFSFVSSPTNSSIAATIIETTGIKPFCASFARVVLFGGNLFGICFEMRD